MSLTGSKHLMQYRHLRQHAIACLVDDDTARPVEDAFVDDDTTSHGQAMHEAAVVASVVEPGLVDAPVDVFLAEFLVAEAVAIMTCG